MGKTHTLTVNPELEERLTTLAERLGVSYHDLAMAILERHADEQERLLAEIQEDEQRWQRYLASGRSIPLNKVRSRLQQLATEAGRSVPQSS